ncbi:ATP/GTP-binding protein [Pyrofollis japonicus]|uniref:PRK13768 family protein n=1 Tax=Pyrofollis japonicus TaxID=3060460 RepID=UPI00295B20C1|nr:ATP/GTP-binding protein [Pyrofollis japonicus]BEP18226.1 ATP/GTP-binding protein [Pyrofollis japonicus]
MYYVIIVGPAGSGKSHLVDALGDWMEFNQLDAARVNLDPAAEWLPYEPEVDVRDYIDTKTVMEKYKLGPNGALVASIDMLTQYVDKVRDEIEATKANYVLIDTPGQMELFAFRDTGPYVLKEIVADHRAVTVFIFDAVFASNPRSLASSIFLAMSTRLRIGLPQINAVSKADLLQPDRMEEINEILNSPDSLYSTLVAEGIDPLLAEASAKALEAIMPSDVAAPAAIRFVSAVSGYGLDDLYAAIQQVLAGGEDFYTEEPSPRL